MNIPFKLPDPPPPFQKKLDLAKMNQKVRKEKAVPVVPPGVPLKPNGFFLPLQNVRPLLEPTPAPVAYISNVLQAEIDKKADAKKAAADAKARQAADKQDDAKGQDGGHPEGSKQSKKDKKKKKDADKQEEEKKKKKKEKPEYPMTKYEDRDDHPTYNGLFLNLKKIRGNIKVVGPDYCFGLADNNLEADYEEPRAPPQPTTPPLCTEYPMSPRPQGTPLDSFNAPAGIVQVVQKVEAPCAHPPLSLRPPPERTEWPVVPLLCDVIQPVLYSDISPDKRRDLIPPPPANVQLEDRHAQLRKKLAKDKRQKQPREIKRVVEPRIRQLSDTSTNSDGTSYSPTTISSKSTELTWPSEPYLPLPSPQDDKHLASDPERQQFMPPHQAALGRSGSQTTRVYNLARPMGTSQVKLGSDARLRDGPSSHRAVIESPSSDAPESPQRMPRPHQESLTRTASRRAVYFTPDQIVASPPSSPLSKPPTPPPKDYPGLREIPPYPGSKSNTSALVRAPSDTTSPAPAPAFATVLPLKVHKRNASNPVAQDPRHVFDYASVTTSRAGGKPQGPPPVLRHRAQLGPLISRPNRLESLPINVKSKARPSTSTTKFRTKTDDELRLGHNRSASEFGQLPSSSRYGVDARPDHNRSASDQSRVLPMRTLLNGRSDMARPQSPSLSTPVYAMGPSASSTTDGRYRAAPGAAHQRMPSEFGHFERNPADRVERTLPYRSNTTTGLDKRLHWI